MSWQNQGGERSGILSNPSPEASSADQTADTFLSQIRMQDWERQWREPPTREYRGCFGPITEDQYYQQHYHMSKQQFDQYLADILKQQPKPESINDRVASIPPKTDSHRTPAPQGQDQPDPFRERIREIWRQNPNWSPDRPFPWSRGDRSHPVSEEQIHRDIEQVCAKIDEEDFIREPTVTHCGWYRLSIRRMIDDDRKLEAEGANQVKPETRTTPSFGVPGHDPWASVRVGNTQYEQVNRSFGDGIMSESALLGIPILASQLGRNITGGAGGALFQVLNGGIGTYSAYTAMRDARLLSAAEGPVGYAKYGLAVAADLGMSAAAFARMSGAGGNWATPAMVLSYFTRNAIGWLPDRTRPADSI